LKKTREGLARSGRADLPNVGVDLNPAGKIRLIILYCEGTVTDLTAPDTSLTEKELLTRLSQGDPNALQEIIEAYFPILCKFAEKYLPDSSLAKDVVQETFIHFWGANATFDDIKGVKGYLFASTRNGCLNLNRGRDRQENRIQDAFGGMEELIADSLTEIIQAENIALIYKVVRSLPWNMREIFRLSYEEGMTLKEISAHLNMNIKAVKNYKYRTLLLLKDKFGKGRGPLLVTLALLLK
jgi:RNA polymerase sigma factor (sigma-70 family)